MRRFRTKRLHEEDEEDFIDGEIDIIKDIEKDEEELTIEDQLYEIGDNLGYDFTSYSGRGSFSISDNVEVSVRYTPEKITSIDTKILKNPAKFNCTKNTTTIDNLSVELQTCVLLIKEIKSKLRT